MALAASVWTLQSNPAGHLPLSGVGHPPGSPPLADTNAAAASAAEAPLERVQATYVAQLIAEYILLFTAAALHPMLTLLTVVMSTWAFTAGLGMSGVGAEAAGSEVGLFAIVSSPFVAKQVALAVFAVVSAWLALRRMRDRRRHPAFLLLSLVPVLGLVWWLFDLGLGGSRRDDPPL